MPFDKQTFIMPTIRIVLALDPQFEQAYFVAAFLLVRAGHKAEGMQLARDGVTANPKSGLLISSLAQMVLVFDKDKKAAAAVADKAFQPGVRWDRPIDEWEGLAELRDIYKLAGETAKYDKVIARMKVLDKVIGKPSPPPVEHIPDVSQYSR
jgi:predicted Zn-dependent protease